MPIVAQAAASSDSLKPEDLGQLLSERQVIDILNVSKTTFWRLVKASKDFPKPIWIGNNKRWRPAEIHAYISAPARLLRPV